MVNIKIDNALLLRCRHQGDELMLLAKEEKVKYKRVCFEEAARTLIKVSEAFNECNPEIDDREEREEREEIEASIRALLL